MFFQSLKSPRGEIITTLTIIGFFLMALGVLVGAQIASQGGLFSYRGQAETQSLNCQFDSGAGYQPYEFKKVCVPTEPEAVTSTNPGYFTVSGEFGLKSGRQPNFSPQDINLYAEVIQGAEYFKTTSGNFITGPTFTFSTGSSTKSYTFGPPPPTSSGEFRLDLQQSWYQDSCPTLKVKIQGGSSSVLNVAEPHVFILHEQGTNPCNAPPTLTPSPPPPEISVCSVSFLNGPPSTGTEITGAEVGQPVWVTVKGRAAHAQKVIVGYDLTTLGAQERQTLSQTFPQAINSFGPDGYKRTYNTDGPKDAQLTISYNDPAATGGTSQYSCGGQINITTLSPTPTPTTTPAPSLTPTLILSPTPTRVVPSPTATPIPAAQVRQIDWFIDSPSDPSDARSPICWFARVTSDINSICNKDQNLDTSGAEQLVCSNESSNTLKITNNSSTQTKRVRCDWYQCNLCAVDPQRTNMARCDESIVSGSWQGNDYATLAPGQSATCHLYNGITTRPPEIGLPASIRAGFIITNNHGTRQINFVQPLICGANNTFEECTPPAVESDFGSVGPGSEGTFTHIFNNFNYVSGEQVLIRADTTYKMGCVVYDETNNEISRCEEKVVLGGSPVTFRFTLAADNQIENSATTQVEQCDLNADKRINTLDYRQLVDKYTVKGQHLPEDINQDGVVDALDLSILIKWIGFEVPERQEMGNE